MRLTSLIALAAAASADIDNALSCDEVPSIRNFFYVGGEYADDGNGGQIFRDQMYVEQLRPANGITQETPIVLIHGQAQTGTNFLNKPDGGRGWVSQFIQQGYEIYLVDQTLRGRSPWQPGRYADSPSTYSTKIIMQRFTAPQKYMLWPQAALHTQWPGNGSTGDPVFDAFYSSNVQFIRNASYQQYSAQAAGAALLDKIGKPAVLMAHSQGGSQPILMADARPALTKAVVLLEPSGPPFREAVFSNSSARAWGLTDIPITYSPPVTDPATDLVQEVHPARDANSTECVLQASLPAPRQLTNLASKPILVVTAEASYHAPYDYCTVEFLRQAGCSKTEFLELAKEGIHGNGHMFLMESNSGQIQELIESWIAKQ